MSSFSYLLCTTVHFSPVYGTVKHAVYMGYLIISMLEIYNLFLIYSFFQGENLQEACMFMEMLVSVLKQVLGSRAFAQG